MSILPKLFVCFILFMGGKNLLWMCYLCCQFDSCGGVQIGKKDNSTLSFMSSTMLGL